MVNSAAEAYKKQQIMTATPEALTLMLYNGALRFMSEGKEESVTSYMDGSRRRRTRRKEL